MKKKTLSILSILFAVVFLMTACQSPEIPSEDDEAEDSTTVADTTTDNTTPADTVPVEEPLEFVDFTDLAGMKIIISDSCDQRIFQASQELYVYMLSERGINLQKGYDGSKKNEPVPEGTAEILLGNTNRPESSSIEYAYGDFSVGYENGRIVINGGSVPAVLNALEWFYENCLGETFLRPDGTYKYKHTATMAELKLYGELLSNYRAESEDFPKEAKYLNEYITMNTGVLNDEATNIITLKNDADNTPSSSAVIKQTYGGMTISICGKLVGIERGLQLFYDILEKRTTDELEINETEKFDLGDGIESLGKDQLDKWRKQSDQKIQSIRNTPNSVSSGTYYVSESDGNDENDGRSPSSPWRTLSKASTAPEGSIVCFKRGDIFRGQLTAKRGCTYTSYGTGIKPRFYRSPGDYKGASNWTNVGGNVWRLNSNMGTGVDNDIGSIIFNNGDDGCAVKVVKTIDGSNKDAVTGRTFSSYKDLKTDLQFFHDIHGDGYVYLYSQTNPGIRFSKSIELNKKGNAISVQADNVTIDNICVKYTGSHGVGAGTVNNLTVKNCEFGWIGGSIQTESYGDRNYGTRYGNAVEIYGGCNGYTVENNYIYQVYDAGITHQHSTDGSYKSNISQKNIKYLNNVIENCNWSIEYWLRETTGVMENLLIEGNQMWYAGEGPLCSNRVDKATGSHIMTWGHGHLPGSGTVIRNNLMVGTDRNMMTVFTNYSSNVPKLSNNNFANKNGAAFGYCTSGSGTNPSDMKYNTEIVKYVDKISTGDTFWFYD